MFVSPQRAHNETHNNVTVSDYRDITKLLSFYSRHASEYHSAVPVTKPKREQSFLKLVINCVSMTPESFPDSARTRRDQGHLAFIGVHNIN